MVNRSPIPAHPIGDNASERRESDAPPVRLLLGGIAALAVAMGIGRFAYTPILPAMQLATHLDTTQAGLLASANYAGYLAGALLTASMTLGAARNRILILCLVATVVTTGIMPATTNLPLWGLIRFGAGMASAGIFVLASGIVLEALHAQRQISLSGWLYTGVGIGIAISGLVVRVAGHALGWRGDWLLLALVAAIALYPSWRWLPIAQTTSAVGSQRHAPLGRHLRLVLLIVMLAYFLEGTGYIVTGTFLVAIVERMRGLVDLGPSVWIVVGLAAIPSGILWSALASHIGYSRALAAAYVVQAGGISIPLLGGAPAVLLAAVSFGGTFIGISALTLTLAGQLAPQRAVAIIGLLTAAFGLGQIIGPILAGILEARTHTFGPALIIASAIVLLGGILMLTVNPEHARR